MLMPSPGRPPYPEQMPDTGPVPPADASAAPARVPARAWLRPALMLVGGALAALLFVQVDQQLAALAAGVFSQIGRAHV